MLSQLRDFHRRVRETVAELADILSGAEVDLRALAETRMKLTRLTGQWRTHVQCAILPQLNHVAPGQPDRLAELRREAADFAVKKSSHIARWTSRTTEADIPGYKRASAEMRKSLLARVELEETILCPLLEAKSAEGAHPLP